MSAANILNKINKEIKNFVQSPSEYGTCLVPEWFI
jgi:hypothetical protein